MALCTSTVFGSGVYYLTVAAPQPADLTNCSGNILLSPTEYLSYVSYTVMPSSADLAQAFDAGFILPMTAFIVAYCVGRLVQMFNTNHEGN